MLHVGTLAAVFVAFWKTIVAVVREAFRMIGDIFTGKFKYSECNEERKMVIMIIIALVPLLGFYFLKDFFSSISEDSDIIIEGVCFLFTSTLLFIASAQKNPVKTGREMTVRDALIIGIFQGIAMLPGVSRSGSTMASSLILGYKRDYAVKFSFILGIPVIMASAAMELKDAAEAGLEIEVLPIVIGMVVAAAVGYLSIALIRWVVNTDKLSLFAVYTLILGVAVVVCGIIERVNGANIVDIVKAMFA